ncbi:MAG: SUMF1/EgtB/PvdO family nonheme iron enzyme [Verrucomicrobia bacterium]|nr:SUMF1/EgtB/PvdO family nonheme iron enzyme [Verrucomicrobiota bacterium]
MSSLSGQTIAGYEVIEKIGEGGMGAVYKARQPLLNRIVALKVMAPNLAADADFVARFKREATLAASFNHPNIVLVYGAGTQGNTHYMAMEFVEGETLRQRIAKHGRIEPREAVAITVYIAQALQYAWNKSRLIHRDIKPDNIFVSKTGEIKVGDLGLAKTVGGPSTSLTQTGMMMGSPHYISPEQASAKKDIDFRADIYSLGCTLYHMLTGRPPYEGDDSLAVIGKHVHEPPPAIFMVWQQCPMPLALLVGKMLAKRPHERPQSYEELIAQLREAHGKLAPVVKPPPASASEPTKMATPTPKPEVAKTPTRKPVPARWSPRFSVFWPGRLKPELQRIVLAGAAMIVIAAVGLVFWSPWNKPSPQDSTTPSLQHSVASTEAALKQLGSVYKNSVGGEMVYIPPGEFMMGSTKEEQAWALANGANEVSVKREGEAPRKTAIKNGFWLGRTEVTVGQWKEFVMATGYKTDAEKKGEATYALDRQKKAWERNLKGASWRDPGFDQEDNHPVGCVSWNDSVAFCEWLTERERKAGRLSAGQAVRLPTEAEWEYACRAGSPSKFWWGESKEDGKDRLNWYETADGFRWVSPVDHYGDRGRNAFGLADMLGNVYEWCLDDCDVKQAHEESYKGNAGRRVLRGGSFHHGPGDVRCAYRYSSPPSHSDSRNGFRVCVGVGLSGAAAATAMGKGGILAPAETRVRALTTKPKVGEVFTLDIGKGVAMELMGIPPGEFLMGSTKEEQAWAVASGRKEEEVKREGEAPRKATIKQGFWMGRTEVTVGQWKEFVTATGYRTEAEKRGFVDSAPRTGQSLEGRVDGLSWRDPGFGSPPQDNHPVCCVIWNDAVAFCEWLTERERKAGRLGAGQVVRLPTEAEWEYACRAGTAGKWWWGDVGKESKGRLNWSGPADGFQFTSLVDHYGARGRNGFGLADMSGNVQEWCLDDYDAAGAHEEAYKGGALRVLRGSTFTGDLGTTRCAARSFRTHNHSNSYNGFRVAVGVER